MAAETHVPELLAHFITHLETTTHSREVWRLIVRLGQRLRLPMIDFISASNMRDWRKTLFIRTSYDSNWLHDLNDDPDIQRWSYFRSHAMHRETPIAVGIEFADEYMPIPEARMDVLRLAATKGIRAGFSIPLRQNAPPQAALITFSGDHSRREMLAIIRAHGWTLHAAAVVAHQRYIRLFEAEFIERNQITDKQKELIVLIGQGLQDKQIAEHLGISVSAVRQRFQMLLQKTRLATRADVAALAMAVGLLPHPFNRPDSEQETLIEMGPESWRVRPARPAQD